MMTRFALNTRSSSRDLNVSFYHFHYSFLYHVYCIVLNIGNGRWRDQLSYRGWCILLFPRGGRYTAWHLRSGRRGLSLTYNSLRSLFYRLVKGRGFAGILAASDLLIFDLQKGGILGPWFSGLDVGPSPTCRSQTGRHGTGLFLISVYVNTCRHGLDIFVYKERLPIAERML